MANERQTQVIDSIIQQVKDSILSDSSVIFIQKDESDETIVGSGTLVSIGDTTAILTADHVLEKLPGAPLFTVGNMYASLCKRGTYAPFSARGRSQALF